MLELGQRQPQRRARDPKARRERELGDALAMAELAVEYELA